MFFKSTGGLRGIKRDLYEGGIRVPMIAQWVGAIPQATVSDQPWAHWDMLPTVAELAGAKAPAGLDGQSMVRALRAQGRIQHDPMYWEFHERGFQQAARLGDWKAVRLKKDAPLELYNLASRSSRDHRRRVDPTGRRQADGSLSCDGPDELGSMAGEVQVRWVRR